MIITGAIGIIVVDIIVIIFHSTFTKMSRKRDIPPHNTGKYFKSIEIDLIKIFVYRHNYFGYSLTIKPLLFNYTKRTCFAAHRTAGIL